LILDTEGGREHLLGEFGQAPAAGGLAAEACEERCPAPPTTGVEGEPNEHLGTDRVRAERLLRAVRVLDHRHDRARSLQLALHRPNEPAQSTALSDDDSTLREGSGSLAQSLPFSDARHGLTALAELVQGADSGRPTDGIDRQAGVALEVEQRLLGLRAEDPVHLAGVEAERAQPALQVGHVVAPQHRGVAIEHAVAQLVAGLDQGGPRLLAADAVVAQPALTLERADRLDGRLAVVPELAGGERGAGGEEAPLDVADGFARGALVEGEVA
jgi:hypothetical protein